MAKVTNPEVRAARGSGPAAGPGCEGEWPCGAVPGCEEGVAPQQRRDVRGEGLHRARKAGIGASPMKHRGSPGTGWGRKPPKSGQALARGRGELLKSGQPQRGEGESC